MQIKPQVCFGIAICAAIIYMLSKNFLVIIFALLLLIASCPFNKIIIAVKKLPGILKCALMIFSAILILNFIIVESRIISRMHDIPNSGADYVVILGCRVNGLIPSRQLTRRVTTAIQYLNENRNTKIVVTGGRGPGENISEAEAMKRILTQNGIGEKRIFEENKSTNTIENLVFSDKLYNLADKKIIIVTSDYHIFRSLAIAKKLKYNNVSGMPSKSQLSRLPVDLLREYFAVIYYTISRRI